MDRHSQQIFSFAASLMVGAVLFASTAAADGPRYRTLNTKRFTLFIGADRSWSRGENDRFDDLAEVAVEVLDATDQELSRIFQVDMAQKVALRFVPADEFQSETGAPGWTNAMFFNGEISIPVSPSLGIDVRELRRALRHEYVHAIVADLTRERGPAWIDEGIAQLIEGPANPILGPALRNWISGNDALPLSWLEDGFMTLDDELVPVAYAQSLFAARTLVNTVGFAAIRQYLTLLGAGLHEELAFTRAFGREKQEFEIQLDRQIRLWAESAELDP